jgi:hypothetical protein
MNVLTTGILVVIGTVLVVWLGFFILAQVTKKSEKNRKDD